MYKHKCDTNLSKYTKYTNYNEFCNAVEEYLTYADVQKFLKDKFNSIKKIKGMIETFSGKNK